MGLRSTIAAWLTPAPAALEERDTFWPFVNVGGLTYPLYGLQQTLQGTTEEIGGDLVGLTGAYRSNGVVFTCLNVRASLFAEARFMFRQLRSGTPGELFSTPELDVLRNPWPGGTTGDLLARMIQFNDLAGNAFAVRRPGRIRVPRPDWMTIILGSERDPDVEAGDLDAEIVGYLYHPGGHYSGRQPVPLLPNEVAPFAPTPDPLASYRGISWLQTLLREIEADSAATAHKLQFFRNGATPNMVVSLDPAITGQAFRDWIELFEKKHAGVANAYKTLYLGAGAKAEVVGADLRQLDFKVTQGAGESRIAAAAGVPPVVAGFSEGLQGSSLNAGNFASSMRRFADLTMRPLWRNVAGSLARIVAVPADAELWYDDRTIPALKDDVMDYAEVQAKQAAAIRQYIDAGFDPATVVDAVNAGDLKRLRHSGLYSVQLQLPVPEQPTAAPVAEEEEEGE
jgi:phage portal protein BeeE